MDKQKSDPYVALCFTEATKIKSTIIHDRKRKRSDSAL